MPLPVLVRLTAFGDPARMAPWRAFTRPGHRRLAALCHTTVNLQGIQVDRAYPMAQYTLSDLVGLATHNIQLLALWQDATRERHWIHVRDKQAFTLPSVGGGPTALLLAHNGRFYRTDAGAPSSRTAADVLARVSDPLVHRRSKALVFDLDGVWAPTTHQAPAGTRWVGPALDVSDLRMGAHLARSHPTTWAGWAPWAVDALRAWCEHQQLRACDVPEAIAAAAGQPEHLAEALASCTEPASQVLSMVRALVAEDMTAVQICEVLPGLLAR